MGILRRAGGMLGRRGADGKAERMIWLELSTSPFVTATGLVSHVVYN